MVETTSSPPRTEHMVRLSLPYNWKGVMIRVHPPLHMGRGVMKLKKGQKIKVKDSISTSK
jgi:hypothetical protein